MDQGQRDWVWALSLKCERPVAECESTPNAFLYIKGGQMDNASRAKLMEPHYFSYEWLRGPTKVSCGYSQCPRGQTFEPLHWSRASLGGCAVACAVCHRLGLRGGEASTFCSEHCFLTGWQEHVPMHAGQSFYPRHGARPRDAESLGDDDQKSPPLQPSSSSSSAGAVQNGSNPQQQRHPRTGSSDSLTYDEDEYVAISQDLTYSPTADDVGCRLRIAVTALAQADGSRLAGPVVITTLPVLSAPRPAPRRAMVQQVSSINLSSSPRFRVVSYNILAELYATRQAYPYADPWSLTWAYRKKLIMQELEEAAGDVVCLQEVQLDHYEADLSPMLTELGFDGLFKQKSRESMGQYGKVDGCAVFWRRSRFLMAENYAIEFNDIARQAALELGLDEAEARRYMNRLSRDNVAQVVVLEVIGAPRQARGSTRLCVANTHLYSNVQRPDVKLWQALSLLQELEQFVVQRDLALLLCGDLNSEPDSAVYELLVGGALSRHHPELSPSPGEAAVLILPEQADIYHNLDLASAMGAVLGQEPAFTNYTQQFKGTLDYILYNPQRLYVTAVGGMPSAQEVQYSSGEGLPSALFPSDHIMLTCDVALTGTGGVTRNQQQHAGGGGHASMLRKGR